ncbi:helix-turn-helix domain-containing protein [Frigoriflavimonas asaccharolytica]|uniref:Plasmid maintenance system antidote protein VapI n=1 Tax=Frigoriflavimonas asaccharolytica TaxID=2735899 RepID=A0A8J8G554_9FLAO|nr:helix-turn-helix transcriptional regulator [Frigoriflavimonas asaccharolytica]NRS91466.1 plasmid maintenance system antidote protein VapI [Frigoriflavimonas asaccharolytica]
MKNINERIEKIIEHSQLSNSEFADAIEVPRSSISHIISGRNKPSLDFLVKIKNEFPTFTWDWMIYGEGEMQKSETDKIENIEKVETKKGEIEKPKAATLPDLFSLIDDENFGATESEDKVLKPIVPDYPTAGQSLKKSILDDSQRLDIEEKFETNKTIENQAVKVKRIVLFYDNGKFETFEP